MTIDTQKLRRRALDIQPISELTARALHDAANHIDAQAAEIEALKHDIAEYVRIASEQGAEIERLREALEELIGWQTTAPERVVDAARAALQGESHE